MEERDFRKLSELELVSSNHTFSPFLSVLLPLALPLYFSLIPTIRSICMKLIIWWHGNRLARVERQGFTNFWTEVTSVSENICASDEVGDWVLGWRYACCHWTLKYMSYKFDSLFIMIVRSIIPILARGKIIICKIRRKDAVRDNSRREDDKLRFFTQHFRCQIITFINQSCSKSVGTFNIGSLSCYLSSNIDRQ